MKSKIEKIKGKYYIYPKNSKDEVVEYLNALCEKQNEIIDHLNSQDQEEENNFVHTVGTPMLDGTTTCSQDTPEEWEKEFEFLYGHLYIQNEDGEFCKINGEVEDMIDFIKQLLEERECRAREELGMEIYDFVESESGKSGRKEILEFISKLKQ